MSPGESPNGGEPLGACAGFGPGRCGSGTTASMGTARLMGQQPQALWWHAAPGGGASTTLHSASVRHSAGT